MYVALMLFPAWPAPLVSRRYWRCAKDRCYVHYANGSMLGYFDTLHVRKHGSILRYFYTLHVRKHVRKHG
jgi:hypothetical protein